jgi:hypothetical protein
VAGKLDYLELLQTAIRQKHKCDAVHRESVFVHESFEGKTIWKGDVEVFDLVDHPEAKKCFAWSHQEKQNNKRVKLITMLDKWPVNSAETAVRTAIFFDVQPVSSRPRT